MGDIFASALCWESKGEGRRKYNLLRWYFSDPDPEPFSDLSKYSC
jgi:hypothetical protein